MTDHMKNITASAKLKMKAAKAQLEALLQSDLSMATQQYWDAFREIQRLMRSAREDVDQVSGVPASRAKYGY